MSALLSLTQLINTMFGQPQHENTEHRSKGLHLMAFELDTHRTFRTNKSMVHAAATYGFQSDTAACVLPFMHKYCSIRLLVSIHCIRQHGLLLSAASLQIAWRVNVTDGL